MLWKIPLFEADAEHTADGTSWRGMSIPVVRRGHEPHSYKWVIDKEATATEANQQA